MISADAVL